jgi:hypothetical protein
MGYSAMTSPLRLKVTIVALLVICVFLGSVIINNLLLARTQNYKSFDPKDYGIPNQIGGYQVMAVVPSENMACAKAGSINLILRALPYQQPTLTDNDLQKIGDAVHLEVQITITSGVVTIDMIKNQVDSWNREMKPSDCVPIGTDFGALPLVAK